MNKLCILLVDDEEELVSPLAERLEFRGMEADAVLSCCDAIKRVEKKKYDVGVIDMKMPGLSGIELMKILQQLQPEMKILLMTGHCSEEEVKNGLARGAVECMVKPIKIDSLITKIKIAAGISEDA